MSINSGPNPYPTPYSDPYSQSNYQHVFQKRHPVSRRSFLGKAGFWVLWVLGCSSLRGIVPVCWDRTMSDGKRIYGFSTKDI